MAQPSAPTSIILAVKGLYLNPSTFGDNAPNGALTIANNVVIDRPSVVATRRGFNNAFSTLVGTGSNGLFQFNNVKLLHGINHKMYADKADNGNFTEYNSEYFEPIPGDEASRVRGLETNKSFYFITADGTYKLDNINNQPRRAGVPPGLSGTGVTTGTGGFFPNNTNIAYRIVFGYKDANQQLVLGAPSSRIVVSNTSGSAANVTVTFQVPKEDGAFLGASYFFQAYRSTPSPNLTTVPDDEMALVYEDTCTGAATITITDITPESLKGASLYTNQGQDGILQSNYRPPWCADVCTFKQFAFYANTRTVQLAAITLIAAGATNGPDAIIPGDTITFSPSDSTPSNPAFSLVAIAGVNNPALGQFQVSNTGNPGVDIQVTASNIALVANAFPTNKFLTAYYTSTDNDLPGKLRFDRISLTVSDFTITASRTASWEQALPVLSTNETRPNRIYYSKFNQPEAVPVVNYVDVGSANAPINRIVPLRDGVMVLKQDGVFRISNAAPPFTVTPIDYNVRILADNTAAELDNKVYFLSDQGVVALSDSDAQIMSFVLDRTIIENTSPTLYPNLRAVAWGLSYQSDRKYILFMPDTKSDTQSQQQYVYNHLTQVWTRWTLGATCGIIFKKDGKMYLGSDQASTPDPNNSYVYQERKTFTDSDYADNVYTTPTTTVGSSNVIVINNTLLPVGVILLPGWTVTQTAAAALARIVTVSVGAVQTVLTLDRIETWAAGNIDIWTPITSIVETIQLDCENPGMNKQFTEMVYMFTEQGFTKLDVLVSSNTAGIPIADVLIPTQRGGWGIDPWGTTPWGGNPSGQGKIRRYVPQRVQRAGWIYLNITNAEAFTSFGWSGVELFYKNMSSRQK